MRLIDTQTLKIREFSAYNIPPYAILSHTWGEDEVTLQEWQDLHSASSKAGYGKIKAACDQALGDGLSYIWIDTNCIDKTSSAELSEAINSMYAWYRDAQVCYVYLADAPDHAGQLTEDGKLQDRNALRNCRWFSRGWTLQELLAPQHVLFFSCSWTSIGTKASLAKPLSDITGIKITYLKGSSLLLASASQRMSWISRRVTSRVEDLAYCMLGIFDINLPLLYGEGLRAFVRLQEEILKVTDDQTLFCWEWQKDVVPDGWANILAPCPAVFKNSAAFAPTNNDEHSEVNPYIITNAGLSIKLPFILTANPSFVCAVLQVRLEWVGGDWDADLPYRQQICLPLEKARICRRLPEPEAPFQLHMAMVSYKRSVYIFSRERTPASSSFPRFLPPPKFDIGFLLILGQQISIDHENMCLPAGGIFYSNRSIIGFNGVYPNSFFAATLTLFHPRGEIRLLLAVRLMTDGTLKFYCQIIPMDLLVQGLKDLDIIELVRGETEGMGDDIDFSSYQNMTVALGDSASFCHDGVLKKAYIVGESSVAHALREDTDSDLSLLGQEDVGAWLRAHCSIRSEGYYD